MASDYFIKSPFTACSSPASLSSSCTIMVAKKKRQNDPQNDSSTDSSEEKQQGSCAHITKAVDMNKLRKVFKIKNVFVNDNCSECVKTTNGTTSAADNAEDKTEFAYDKTLWLCLNCGSHLCGRSKNRHALLHHEVNIPWVKSSLPNPQDMQ